KKELTLKKFHNNMLDPIKFTFDMKFLGQTSEEKIKAEIERKIDKSVSNAIGNFHERLLGGIEGLKHYPVGAGYDVKSEDNLIYADVKNKHNTVKGDNLRDLYTKLEGFVADENIQNEKAYWVQIIAPKSFN